MTTKIRALLDDMSQMHAGTEITDQLMAAIVEYGHGMRTTPAGSDEEEAAVAELQRNIQEVCAEVDRLRDDLLLLCKTTSRITGEMGQTPHASELLEAIESALSR